MSLRKNSIRVIPRVSFLEDYKSFFDEIFQIRLCGRIPRGYLRKNSKGVFFEGYQKCRKIKEGLQVSNAKLIFCITIRRH